MLLFFKVNATEAQKTVSISMTIICFNFGFLTVKTEFSAIPVFLHRDDRISAHFTTCFISLMFFRIFKKAFGHKYTAQEIIKNLCQVKFFKTTEGYMSAYTRTDFTNLLHDIFGIRTDFQIIPFSDIKKIISYSKKDLTYCISI